MWREERRLHFISDKYTNFTLCKQVHNKYLQKVNYTVHKITTYSFKLTGLEQNAIIIIMWREERSFQITIHFKTRITWCKIYIKNTVQSTQAPQEHSTLETKISTRTKTK